MEVKAKKASNEQKSFLIEYMETHVQFANDRFESVDGGRLRAKKWEELAATLNSLGGAIKVAAKWRKFWSDQKSHAKDKEVLRRAALQKSGVNCLGRMKEASEFERRVLQLTTPVVVAGDDNVIELLTVTQSTEEELLVQVLEAQAPSHPQNIRHCRCCQHRLWHLPHLYCLPLSTLIHHQLRCQK